MPKGGRSPPESPTEFLPYRSATVVGGKIRRISVVPFFGEKARWIYSSNAGFLFLPGKGTKASTRENKDFKGAFLKEGEKNAFLCAPTFWDY